SPRDLEPPGTLRNYPRTSANPGFSRGKSRFSDSFLAATPLAVRAGAIHPRAQHADELLHLVDLERHRDRRVEEDARAAVARLAALVRVPVELTVEAVRRFQDGLAESFVGVLPGLAERGHRLGAAVDREHAATFSGTSACRQARAADRLRCNRPCGLRSS